MAPAGDGIYGRGATTLAAAAKLRDGPPAHVRLAVNAHRALHAAARRAAPAEACGLLAGTCVAGPRGTVAAVAAFVPLRNLAAGPAQFRCDPVEFARAHAALGRQGLQLLGFAHSHPTGPAALSAADREQLWRGCVQLVVAGGDGGGWHTTAWWGARDGGFRELPCAIGRAAGAAP